MPTLKPLKPISQKDMSHKEDMSATKRISDMINRAEDTKNGNVWALVATVFFKYGMSPLIVLLFGYWLQVCFQQILIKDQQIMAIYEKQQVRDERVTISLDANTKASERNTEAFKELKEEIRNKR